MFLPIFSKPISVLSPNLRFSKEWNNRIGGETDIIQSRLPADFMMKGSNRLILHHSASRKDAERFSAEFGPIKSR